MSTLSKQVANRVKTAAHVKSSYEVNADAIAREVARQIPGLNKSDVSKVIDAVIAHFDTSTETLRVAEHTYTTEQADDPQHRDQRDTDASALAERVAQVREAVRSTLGASAVTRYGLHGNTPTSPGDLAEMAANAVELLRAYPATTSPVPGITVDTAALADDLQSHLDALRTSLDAVGIEDRELHVAKTARDAAIAQWTQLYPGVGALLEGFYRIAGRADLAARIRPTQRRASGYEVAAPEADVEPQPEVDPTEPVPQDDVIPEPA